MASALQTVFGLAFAVLWFGGEFFLFFRGRATQRAYLSRFDPVDGFPLDSTPVGLPRDVRLAIWDAMWDWQFDPELEALRHKVWVQFWWMAAWIFGFPLTIAAAVVVIVLTGHGAILG